MSSIINRLKFWNKKEIAISSVREEGHEYLIKSCVPTQPCRCLSPEVMDIAAMIAHGEEEKKTYFCKSYNSFSGVDAKAFFSKEKEMSFYKTVEEHDEWKKKFIYIPEMQGFSYKVGANGYPVTGDLIFVVFDESQFLKLHEYDNLYVKVANEYGAMALLSFHGVKIESMCSSLSIDDIIMEEQITFSATKLVPWKKL